MILLTLHPGPGIDELTATPSSYSEPCRAQFSAMPGVYWNKTKQGYIGDRIAIQTVANLLSDAKIARVVNAIEPRLDYPLIAGLPYAWPVALHDYQRHGANWIRESLAQHDAALLADGMGLGKSAQAIAALDAYLDPLDARVIVCPAVVKRHWLKELKKWAKTNEHVPCAWYIYSYEGFIKALSGKPSKGDVALPSTVHALVLDEIHYLSNSRAKRSKAIADWLKLNPSVMRLGLSGTPMTTRPKDLWHVLNILYPKRFGSFFQFTKRYCAGNYVTIKGVENPIWQCDGASNLPELGARLELIMLRRTKADVSAELPRRTRITVDVELPKTAAKNLNAALNAINFTDARVGVGTLLSNIESHKIKAACELAQECIENNRKVLLLTTRKASAESISTELECPIATGDDEPGRRAEILQCGDCAVATIYAVTTGIDLVHFNTIIFVGLDWVPSTLLQAEARIDRLSQTSDDILIYYLIGLSTLDEVVKDKVIERLEQFSQVVGTEESNLAGDLACLDADALLQSMIDSLRQEMEI